ncbi:hypothetical protein FA95DRAFT_1565555 [Auriscalpium vulgare]|uniref:Uncharacterized protein n=1 Tax=Auriscalpium vulgare TaxID=40419 RepID=A0ACB8RB23_9AGAM|nr:hypothetical protein FA95DRAFT_1565555 [Auriscalpium vulgare]
MQLSSGTILCAVEQGWWNGFMALQVISTYELDDSPRSDRLLAHANAEAVKVLVPNATDVTSDERAPGELNQPALLDWVGASFCQRGSTKKYYVEDAGQSLVMGEFFVLRTDGGQREQVSLDTFRNMVHGLVPLEELEA